MKNDAKTLSKQETTILFVSGKPEQKEKFVSLISGKAYKLRCEDNSFKAIQTLKLNDALAITVIVLDKNVKPLGSFQTYDFIRSELGLNIPILILQGEGGKTDYTNYEGLEILDLDNPEKSLSTLENFVAYQQDFNGHDPMAYSLNYLKELSDNNEAFVNASIELFLSSVSERMNEMKAMLSKNKFKKISKIAHNIKPSFGMIENEAGHELCDYMAHHATKEELPEMVEKLDSLFIKLKNQLIIDFPSYSTL